MQLAQLLAWEAQADFMDAVRGDNTHWITKRPLIMEAFLARAQNAEDKSQMIYAAAYLILIGDPAGHTLAGLAGKA